MSLYLLESYKMSKTIEMIKEGIINSIIDNHCSYPMIIEKSMSSNVKNSIKKEIFNSVIKSPFIEEDLNATANLLLNFFNRVRFFIGFHYKINYHNQFSDTADKYQTFSLNEIFYSSNMYEKIMLSFSRSGIGSAGKKLIFSSKAKTSLKTITDKNKNKFKPSELSFSGSDHVFNNSVAFYVESELKKIILENIQTYNISLKISSLLFNINRKLNLSKLFFVDYVGGEYVSIKEIISRLEDNIDLINLQSDSTIEAELKKLKKYVKNNLV